MLRREFLLGMLVMAAVPVTANARRRSFGMGMGSSSDDQKTRTAKYYIGIAIGGIVVTSVVWRAAAYVINAYQRTQLPPPPQWMPAPPLPEAKSVVSRQRPVAVKSFGTRR